MTPWWVLVIQGGSAILLGVLLLSVPAVGSDGLPGALGLYWVVTATLALVRAFIDHTVWGVKVVTTALGIGSGVWVIGTPLSVALPPEARPWAIGLLAIGIGATQLAEAFYERSLQLAALAALSVLIGMLVAFSTAGSALMLPVIAGASAIAAGSFAALSALPRH